MKTRKISFRWKLFRSYTLLLILALVVVFLLSWLSSRAISIEVEKIALMNAEEMKSNFDIAGKNLESIVSTLATQREVIEPSNNTVLENRNTGYEEVRKLLATQKYYTASIGEIYVFYPEYKTIVSGNYAYSNDLAEDLCLRIFGSGFSQTLDTLNKKHTHIITGTKDPYPILAASRSIISGFDRVGIVCATLHNASMKELLTNYEYPNGSFYILSEEKRYTSDSVTLDVPTEILLSLSEGISNVKFNGIRIVTALSKSRYYPLQFVSVISEKDFTSSIRYLEQITIIIIIALAITGLVVSGIQSRKHAKPLQRLMDLLSTDGEIRENEFDQLETTLISLMRHRVQSEKTQEDYDELVRQQLLEMLLNFKITDTDSFYDSANKLRLGLTGNHFRVAAIRVLTELPKTDESSDTLRLVIDSIVTHETQKETGVTPVFLEGLYIYILSSSEPGDYSSIKWQNVILLLKQQFNIQVQIAISKESDYLLGIPKRYNAVKELLETSAMYNMSDEILLENDEDELKRTLVPMEAERHIITAILAQDYLRAEQLISNELNAPDTISYGDLESLRHMLQTIVLTLEDMRSLYDQTFFNQLNVRQLLEITNIQELRDKIHYIFSTLNNQVAQREDKVNKLAKSIIDFISENYANPQLSRSYIAEHMSISVSYISHVMKESSNSSILDIIQKTRCEAAKKLLADTSIVLQDVAERVGYSSVWTFARVFKSVEGVTPGKFREMVSK